ncbi:P-loop NTPase family protein [Halorubrum pallidum]|uniref:KaiC domain-containing protein n=1 Tax=Halorubrum pallidum TaxID=1526114 RepID=A0ABD5T2H8_9EURY
MSEEDDWFERALRDLDGESDSDDDPADAGDGGSDSDGGETRSEGTSDRDADRGGPKGEDDPFGGVRKADGDEGGDADPFGGVQKADGDEEEDADPFGGYRGTAPSPDDEFGFANFDDGEGGAGGPGERSSSGARDASDPAEFDVDPDEFESAIPRVDVGIEGLDEMILGGVPARSLISVIGGAGTGKTTFALQFLNETLEADGKGVYITLEQTRESILSTAAEKGWSFEEHADDGRLAVVAIDPIEMANSLASIRNDLTRLIAKFDADRLVLDSVSLLEMMYDHPSKRRSEVFGFTRSLKEAGVTTLLTSEASEESPYASRHGIVEYLTDAVFVLQYVRGSDSRETRLAVEIQKIRDANHSRETKPYDITDGGISVYDQANIF